MKLEIGYNHSFEIRREAYSCSFKINFSILFLSDLHFNKNSGPTAARLVDAINELNPTLILLGGDYADTRAGLAHLGNLLTAMVGRKNVIAIAGNHDRFFGVEKIKALMMAHNVNWMDGSPVALTIDSQPVLVSGAPLPAHTGNPALAILLLHQPISLANIIPHYQLAFAGHLHGCQFVFRETPDGLYPGKLFYKNNFLKKQAGGCTYLISKGLGDTLPVRYNCKKDIIFVEVSGSNAASLQ